MRAAPPPSPLSVRAGQKGCAQAPARVRSTAGASSTAGAVVVGDWSSRNRRWLPPKPQCRPAPLWSNWAWSVVHVQLRRMPKLGSLSASTVERVWSNESGQRLLQPPLHHRVFHRSSPPLPGSVRCAPKSARGVAPPILAPPADGAVDRCAALRRELGGLAERRRRFGALGVDRRSGVDGP